MQTASNSKSVRTNVVDTAGDAAADDAGISAMGLYFYGPDASFISAATQLCKALDSMSAGIADPADKLLTISSQTQKFLCKQRPPGSASTASLAVCDFKLARCLQSFIPLQCRSVLQPFALLVSNYLEEPYPVPCSTTLGCLYKVFYAKKLFHTWRNTL